jgi:hypothetical protein
MALMEWCCKKGFIVRLQLLSKLWETYFRFFCKHRQYNQYTFKFK